ncbi:Crp/Fnr family transcriptional regulator [Clostridium sp.]|uniref:Crp/Fnr family transcriptional regulator n=1 Tax=Clostridium sp. TaxID=1506 RepID=UPI00346448C8
MKNFNYIETLKTNKLFKVFTEDEIEKLMKNLTYSIKDYGKEDIIFMEDETCKSLSIILKGSVEIQKIDSSGKVLKVSKFKSGDVFGENLLFGDKNTYPMTVVSTDNSLIMHISKDSLSKLCESHSNFLYEFLKIQSNKALALSSKIKEVTLKTIKQKVCEFLLNEYEKSKNTTIKLDMSKKEWADRLGVQRPSLSRELIKLKEEGVIDYDKDYIVIKDIEILEDLLL